MSALIQYIVKEILRVAESINDWVSDNFALKRAFYTRTDISILYPRLVVRTSMGGFQMNSLSS